jgi:hypothetical protein
LKEFSLLSSGVIICAFLVATTSAVPVNDAYIEGYAAAVLEREFQVASDSLRVQDGVITVDPGNLTGADRERMIAALARIRGVTRVEIVEAGHQPTTATSPTPTQSAAGPEAERPVREAERLPDSTFLPEGQLFDPLLADPRWPHFSAAYRYHLDDEELGSVGAADFGETFALYRAPMPFGGQWEVGLQAGVFSIFDLTTNSKDLVNADYTVGLPLSYRTGAFSVLARLFHQSSHLGDEFLLRNRVERINLSYESADLKLSYHFSPSLRLYGGGGVLFNREPSDLKPWTTQYGVELKSPWAYAGGAVQPLVAADVHNNEESNWSTDLSLRAGIEFENLRVVSRKLQLMVEYFKGYSPNGQFYRRKIETIGIGAHLHF